MRIKYEAIDIFSGCGGVSCGLSLAGFKIKSAVEIEKHAVDTYLNYEPLSKVNVLNEDICKLSGEKILKAAKIKKDDIYLLYYYGIKLLYFLTFISSFFIYISIITQIIKIHTMKEKSYYLNSYVLSRKFCPHLY